MAPKDEQAGLYDDYRKELRLKENNLIKPVVEGKKGETVLLSDVLSDVPTASV